MIVFVVLVYNQLYELYDRGGFTSKVDRIFASASEKRFK